MPSGERIQELIAEICQEIFDYITHHEQQAAERWVPAAQIKADLALNFLAVPKHKKQYGEKGWFFAIIARMLEDQDKVEYTMMNGRAYYRSRAPQVSE